MQKLKKNIYIKMQILPFWKYIYLDSFNKVKLTNINSQDYR